MKNFFKKIEEISGAVELQLNIKAKDGNITVMVTPISKVKDAAAKTIKPLIINGSADDLDEGFLETVIAPMEKIAGIVHNIATFEANADKISKESEAAKKQQEQEKNERQAKKKKYEALMAKVEAFEKEENFKAALGAAEQAKQFADKPDYVDKKITDLKSKLAQGSMFASDAAEAEAAPVDYLADYKEEVLETKPKEDEPEPEEELDEQEGGEE